MRMVRCAELVVQAQALTVQELVAGPHCAQGMRGHTTAPTCAFWQAVVGPYGPSRSTFMNTFQAGSGKTGVVPVRKGTGCTAGSGQQQGTCSLSTGSRRARERFPVQQFPAHAQEFRGHAQDVSTGARRWLQEPLAARAGQHTTHGEGCPCCTSDTLSHTLRCRCRRPKSRSLVSGHRTARSRAGSRSRWSLGLLG